MHIVIADTGPINYLVLIGNVDILPLLFEGVILPSAGQAELMDPDAPPSVRLDSESPAWLAIFETSESQFDQAFVEGLDEGETAELAGHRSAANGRRPGVTVARGMGLRVTGTLGVLDIAAQRGLVGFPDANRPPLADEFSNPGSASRFVAEETSAGRRRHVNSPGVPQRNSAPAASDS